MAIKTRSRGSPGSPRGEDSAESHPLKGAASAPALSGAAEERRSDGGGARRGAHCWALWLPLLALVGMVLVLRAVDTVPAAHQSFVKVQGTQASRRQGMGSRQRGGRGAGNWALGSYCCPSWPAHLLSPFCFCRQQFTLDCRSFLVSGFNVGGCLPLCFPERSMVGGAGDARGQQAALSCLCRCQWCQGDPTSPHTAHPCLPCYLLLLADNIAQAPLPQLARKLAGGRGGTAIVRSVFQQAAQAGLNVVRTFAHTTDPMYPLQVSQVPALAKGGGQPPGGAALRHDAAWLAPPFITHSLHACG